MERIAKSPAGPFVAQAFRPPAGRRSSPDGLRYAQPGQTWRAALRSVRNALI